MPSGGDRYDDTVDFDAVLDAYEYNREKPPTPTPRERYKKYERKLYLDCSDRYQASDLGTKRSTYQFDATTLNKANPLISHHIPCHPREAKLFKDDLPIWRAEMALLDMNLPISPSTKIPLS